MSKHLKVTDVLVDAGETENEAVKGCLGDFLLCGVSELCFKLCDEVKVSIFDVVSHWVELFETFEDPFYLSVHLQSFDECQRDYNVPYQRFEA